MFVRSGGRPRHFSVFDGSQATYKKTTHFGIYYSIFVVDNKHANQGSQCSSVPTYMFTLVVHNIACLLVLVALCQLGGAQDDFACSLSIFLRCTMHVQCCQFQCVEALYATNVDSIEEILIVGWPRTGFGDFNITTKSIDFLLLFQKGV